MRLSSVAVGSSAGHVSISWVAYGKPNELFQGEKQLFIYKNQTVSHMFFHVIRSFLDLLCMY